VSGEYSVSLLQELLSQRTHWNEEKQELIHQLEVSTQQVYHYGISCVISGVFITFGTLLNPLLVLLCVTVWVWLL